MELYNPQATQPVSSLKPYHTYGLPAGDGVNPISPLASQLQSQGRGEDSTLVHMTPGEVNSLRGLAQKFGGDLTTNPNTGLPEAGFLSSILPVVAGGLLSLIPGVGPLAAAGIIGAGSTAITGDLSKGLMAGLGAFGGASLAGSLGAGAASGAASTGSSAASAVGSTANPAPLAESLASGATSGAGAGLGTPLSQLPGDMLAQQAVSSLGTPLSQLPGDMLAQQALAGQTGAGLGAKAPGFMSRFAAASREGLPAGGMLSKGAPYAAGLGLLNAGSQALQPNLPKYEPEEETPYEGPYKVTPRRVLPPLAGGSSREQLWFGPREGTGIYGSAGYAGGGEARYNFSSSKDIALPEAVRGGGMAEMGGLAGLPLSVASGGSPYNAQWVQSLSSISSKAPKQVNWEQYVNANPDAMAQWGSNDPGVAAMKAAGQGIGDFGRFHYSNDGMRRDISAFKVAPPQLAPGSTGERRYNFSGSDALRSSVPTPKSLDPLANLPFYGFASGGETIQDGSFIVDARTVSEIGNGSSNAGIEALSRMGGSPIRGPGDGVSDSIKASLEGQPARVARDEVKFSPDAVKKLGGGSHKKGTEKLYSLMRKVHNARKKAGRGEDTKMAKGLASL